MLIERAGPGDADVLPPARGCKGKGGGGGGIEAPNTLQSLATVRIIDLLGEGQIGGLVNGAKSIYFNGVPLMNSAGGYNFKGVTWDLRTGAPDQTCVTGFPSVETTVPIGVLVSQHYSQEYTVTDATATRAIITLELPALLYTDTSNGNINPTSVALQIGVTPVGGTETIVVSDTISGKCTSTYERSYTITLPTGGSPWTVKVHRLTPDSSTANMVNAFYWAAIDILTDYQLIYPNSAYVALSFDSQLFGSTLPTRTYDVVGMIINVPNNYDAATRTYTGLWDGVSFQPANTDNPAFIVMDLIANQRYGMGVPQPLLEAALFDLYAIAQYCDELIPDSFSESGTRPRYTCNVCVSSRDDAYAVLQSFTSIFRGMSFWGTGTIRFVADMPGNVVKLVSQADVIGGEFSYQGSALKTRSTLTIGTFLYPANEWQPTPVLYQNQANINPNFGQNIENISVFGASNYGQAYLACKWTQYTEWNQTEVVTYQAGLDHVDLLPGEIFEIADPAYEGIRWSGRVISSSTTGGHTSIITDAPLAMGGVTVVSVTARGSGYLAAPTIAFTGSGTGATATATVSGGQLDQIIVTNMGTGYATPPTVTITPTSGGSGATAITTVSPIDTTVLLDLEVAVEGTGLTIVGNLAVTSILDNGNGTSTILLATALATLPADGALWILKSDQLIPRQFRVIGLSEPNPGVIEVQALFHDPNKYAYIEYGVNLTDTPNSNYGDPYGDDILPPSAVTAQDCYQGQGTTTVLVTTIGWTASTDGRVQSYQVQASGDTGYNAAFSCPGVSYDIDDLPIGNYVFAVRGVTGDGRMSVWAVSQQLLINGSPIVPPAPEGFTALGGTRQITLSWSPVAVANLYYYEVWSAPDVSGAPGTFTLLTQVTATTYTDTRSNVLQPLTKYWYEVRAVTTVLTYGDFSAQVSATTTNLLVADLPLAIQSTAAFAQTILSGAPTVVATLPGAPPGGVGFVVLSTSSPPGQLYEWNNTTMAWVATPMIVDPSSGKLVAGVIEAGVVSADQIAANSINAGCLASTTLLTLQAQIGYAVVGTLQLINDTVTSYANGSFTGPVSGTGTGTLNTLVSMAVTVPAYSDGDEQTRVGVAFVTIEQGFASGDGHYRVQLTQDGTTLFDRTVDFYLDYVTLQVNVTINSSATNEFVLSWAGDSGISAGTSNLTVLARIT
jgi:predicted phage tail protein